jgi:hypothetical protein
VDANRGIRVSHFSGVLSYTAVTHSIFAGCLFALLLSEREGTDISNMLNILSNLYLSFQYRS